MITIAKLFTGTTGKFLDIQVQENPLTVQLTSSAGTLKLDKEAACELTTCLTDLLLNRFHKESTTNRQPVHHPYILESTVMLTEEVGKDREAFPMLLSWDGYVPGDVLYYDRASTKVIVKQKQPLSGGTVYIVQIYSNDPDDFILGKYLIPGTQWLRLEP